MLHIANTHQFVAPAAFLFVGDPVLGVMPIPPSYPPGGPDSLLMGAVQVPPPAYTLVDQSNYAFAQPAAQTFNQAPPRMFNPVPAFLYPLYPLYPLPTYPLYPLLL